MSTTELQDLVDTPLDEVPIDSHLLFYKFTVDDVGKTITTHQFPKKGHEREKNKNQRIHSA